MKASKVLKFITGLLEGVLAIPILGGTIVISFAGIPLGIMFVLHLVTLIVSKKQGETIYGSVCGIITSCVGFIPFVGWILHLLSFILLLISTFQSKSQNYQMQ